MKQEWPTLIIAESLLLCMLKISTVERILKGTTCYGQMLKKELNSQRQSFTSPLFSILAGFAHDLAHRHGPQRLIIHIPTPQRAGTSVQTGMGLLVWLTCMQRP